jgi:hypothetical protein
VARKQSPHAFDRTVQGDDLPSTNRKAEEIQGFVATGLEEGRTQSVDEKRMNYQPILPPQNGSEQDLAPTTRRGRNWTGLAEIWPQLDELIRSGSDQGSRRANRCAQIRLNHQVDLTVWKINGDNPGVVAST